MSKGAIHPNDSNFRKVARLDVVSRVRILHHQNLLRERPKWLEWCERVPPMENHNLLLQARTVRNPYKQLIGHLLKKYPDLRFQDCYVDGNDWTTGCDAYRNDHPVMQFVGRQLEFMNQGMSKKEAFKLTEEIFRERREHLEQEQKVMMAKAVDAGFTPMFTTGRAYLEAEKVKAEVAHLEKIRSLLRRSRRDRELEGEEASPEQAALQEERRQRVRLMELSRRGAVKEELRAEPEHEAEAGAPEPKPLPEPIFTEPDEPAKQTPAPSPERERPTTPVQSPEAPQKPQDAMLITRTAQPRTQKRADVTQMFGGTQYMTNLDEVSEPGSPTGKATGAEEGEWDEDEELEPLPRPKARKSKGGRGRGGFGSGLGGLG